MASDADQNHEYMLGETDVRAMVRLLADVAVTAGGVIAQKRRLIEGIAELVGADNWMWNISRNSPGKAPVAVSVLHNFTEKQFAVLAEGYSKDLMRDFDDPLRDLVQEHEHFTRHIAQLVPREQFEKTPAAQVWRDTGVLCGESLFTFFNVPDRDHLISAVAVHRTAERQRFTEREARILHILTSEVRWLHEMAVPEEDGRSMVHLSPRLQTVLHMLIDGQSAKRIAYHLELSEHTVRGYVKDIYRHFDVGSRADLMRRFMVGDGGDRA